MENRIFKYEMTIKEAHLDTFGHVNNATYLQIYEEARWQLATENGYGLEKIKETGLAPIILEINLRFIKELQLRKKIIIHSQTGEFTSKIGVIKQWISDIDGNLCADTEMKIGLFDTHKRKLVEPTQDWLNAIK
jgi:YbgC/YbaW family acyl-CoA thioester hydrolase